MTFYSRTKKLKKLQYGDLNEIVLTSYNQQKNVQFFLPFSLNTIMFLDGYKSKVILSKCSLKLGLYECMINILLCKKSWWISIRVLIKGIVKKAILYLWEKDEIVF